jgi:hypothetical protein
MTQKQLRLNNLLLSLFPIILLPLFHRLLQLLTLMLRNILQQHLKKEYLQIIRNRLRLLGVHLYKVFYVLLKRHKHLLELVVCLREFVDLVELLALGGFEGCHELLELWVRGERVLKFC